MVWVRSEYAGELAVVSAWLSALIPWNVTYSPDIAGGNLLFVRFPLFQIRYNYGVPFGRALRVTDPLSATMFQQGESIALAYAVWTIGAVLVGATVVYAAAYYGAEGVVDSWPLDPVRVIGGLLAGAAVVLAAATYLLVTRGFPGVPVPVGVVFLVVFGTVLLRVERT
jgi:hypothetical protein